MFSDYQWNEKSYFLYDKKFQLCRDGSTSEQTLEDQLHTILEVREQIKLELIKVIEFEEKLARISPQRLEMLRPDMLTPYSIEKLSSEFPFLNWNDFFDSALHTTLDEGKLNLGFYLFSLNI